MRYDDGMHISPYIYLVLSNLLLYLSPCRWGVQLSSTGPIYVLQQQAAAAVKNNARRIYYYTLRIERPSIVAAGGSNAHNSHLAPHMKHDQLIISLTTGGRWVWCACSPIYASHLTQSRELSVGGRRGRVMFRGLCILLQKKKKTYCT